MRHVKKAKSIEKTSQERGFNKKRLVETRKMRSQRKRLAKRHAGASDLGQAPRELDFDKRRLVKHVKKRNQLGKGKKTRQRTFETQFY